MPNLNGFTPSFASCSRPRIRPRAQVHRAAASRASRACPRASGCRSPSRRYPVARELVVGRQRRVRLAVALGLHDLLQHLPARAALGIVARQRLARRSPSSSNMRPFERLPLCGMASSCRPSSSRTRPSRPRASPGPRSATARTGSTWSRLVLAVAEEHVAVQVVAARHRRPLVADHRGEPARLVVLLGRRRVLLPDRLHDRPDDLRILDRRRQRALRLRGDQLVLRLRRFLAARLQRRVPSGRAIGIRMNAGLPL